MLTMDQLVLINLSRSLQTSSVINFVTSLCLILQMCKNSPSKTLHRAWLVTQLIACLWHAVLTIQNQGTQEVVAQIKVRTPFSFFSCFPLFSSFDLLFSNIFLPAHGGDAEQREQDIRERRHWQNWEEAGPQEALLDRG